MIIDALKIASDPNLDETLGETLVPLIEEQKRAVSVNFAQRNAQVRAVVNGISRNTAHSLDNHFFQDEPLAFNLFLLTCELPRSELLFNTLHDFINNLDHKLFISGHGRALRQYRNALCHHQTDARLLEFWYSHFNTPDDDGLSLSDEEQDRVLEGWSGILELYGPIANQPSKIQSAVKCLDALSTMGNNLGNRPESVDILKYSLHQLTEYFSDLSSEKWSFAVFLILPSCPPLLREIVQDHFADHEIWKDFSSDQIDTIIQSAKKADFGPLDNLLFNPKLPHSTRRILPQLKSFLTEFFQHSDPAEGRRLKLRQKAKKEQESTDHNSKQAGSVHATDLVTVNSVLNKVKQLLEKNKTNQAKKYISELIDDQKASDTPDSLIAKTLCNASRLAIQFSDLNWADSLLAQAVKTAPEDIVPLTSQAELFRHRGELGKAEQLYKKTVELWPNDVVAHTGL
ncbi:MAG: hypothetical protein HQL54_08260, partial [Magnetococcales bacterium]|nr:hypothetical protein [Magnetococcales bacterium]